MADRSTLVKIFDEMKGKEFKRAKTYLQEYEIPAGKLEEAKESDDIAHRLLSHLEPGRCKQVVREVLEKVPCQELLGRFEDFLSPRPVVSAIKAQNKNQVVRAQKTLLESDMKIKTRRGRVMIVGQYGVGKTSLKRSLFREEFNPKHDSTRGIDLVRFSIDISTFFAVTDQTKGSPTQMTMRKLLANKMCDLLKEEQHDKPIQNHNANKSIKPEVISGQHHAAVTDDVFEDENKDDVELPELFSHLILEGEDEQTLLESLNVNKLDMDMDSFCDFGLWDFAGQSVYYTTHQTLAGLFSILAVLGRTRHSSEQNCQVSAKVFLDNKSIFLLVADASHDLDDECPMDKCESREEQQCWKKKMKYKDYLSFWLNSIHTCSQKSSEKIIIDGQEYMAPLVILVATKKDKLDQGQQDYFIQDMRLYLAEACEEAYDAHVFQKTFIVDNSRSGTEEEGPEIKDLRECLKEIADDPIFTENVPVQWLRLELELKALRDLEKHVMKISFFNQYAAKFGIAERDTPEVVKYFHKIGIAYFIKDLLVLEAKWLTNILSRVILMKLGDFSIKHPKKIERFLINLRRYGILHDDLLDFVLDEKKRIRSTRSGDDFSGISQIVDAPHASNEKMELLSGVHKDSSVATEQSVHNIVIQLLEHFDLLYPLHFGDRSKVYIVPSLLQLDRLEALPLGEKKSYHTLPLYYQFSGGFLPEGFYYRLVVRCLQKCNLKIDEMTLKKNLRYHHARIPVSRRHQITLTKLGPNIVLIMWYSTSERTFQPLHPKPNPAECRRARILVEEAMNYIINTWMHSLRYEAKVICSCKTHKTKYEDEDSEKWIGDNDFVYHDVKVDPPYQVVKKDDEVPEMDLREEIAQGRKYDGPYKVQCTEMSCMMDLEPVRVWFGASHSLRFATKDFLERMPKLGVVAFPCVVVVFVWLFVLGVQSALFQCTAFSSVKGIALLVQGVVIFLVLISGFSLATWLCIFYSRTDDEYRNVRALFLVVASLMFIYMPLFIKEIAKMADECPDSEPVDAVGNQTVT